ncbi:hypothetical protein KIW84_UN0881 [Lathyrus oleraceus]|nr:hypothetical protein KIW84_UN0881 [Pisum sativum]
MSIPLILIKNLVKRNQVWKMLIRVVDFWVGDQIHVTIHNREFKDWIEQLIEHETYCLYNGEPMVNDGTFEVCPNKLKLVFNGGTIVSKMQIPAIPLHQFKFKAIDDFLNGKFTTDLLYGDLYVVGVLQDVVKTQMGGGGKKSCVNITLGNEAGNVIRVALWEDYAKQFMSYNNSNNFLVQHYLFNTCMVLASTQLSITLSTSLTQASQSFVQSGNKNWTNLNEIKSIGQISDTIKHTSKAAFLVVDKDVGLDIDHEPIESETPELSLFALLQASAKIDCSSSTCSSNTPAKRVSVPISIDDIFKDEVFTQK